MQAPISSHVVLILLLLYFTISSKVAADPSASYTSASPAVPGVYGTNTANGDGVFGSATTGRGVVGASESGIGVQGNAKEGRGVVGISATKAGVEGQSQGHVGVWGETRAPSGAGGEFYNNGGGDSHSCWARWSVPRVEQRRCLCTRADDRYGRTSRATGATRITRSCCAYHCGVWWWRWSGQMQLYWSRNCASGC